MRFVAIDVEMANPDMASICAIGICIFDSGRAIEHMHFLIDPGDYFDRLNVSIHGITAAMVQGAPNMGKVLPVMARALADNVVVHHTHFDRVSLQRAAARHELPPLGCRWLDSARVARRTWDDVAFGGYGLRNLADKCGIQFQHHDAREDARAAGLVLIEAIKQSGRPLEDWFARVEQAIDLERAAKERAKFAGNPAGHMAGETVVFTGRVEFPRIEMAERAAAAGCNVDPGLTKATTILVVGNQDVRVVGATGKSAKHRKAEKMIASGAALRIIGETDFFDLLRG